MNKVQKYAERIALLFIHKDTEDKRPKVAQALREFLSEVDADREAQRNLDRMETINRLKMASKEEQILYKNQIKSMLQNNFR